MDHSLKPFSCLFFHMKILLLTKLIWRPCDFSIGLRTICHYAQHLQMDDIYQMKREQGREREREQGWVRVRVRVQERERVRVHQQLRFFHPFVLG